MYNCVKNSLEILKFINIYNLELLQNFLSKFKSLVNNYENRSKKQRPLLVGCFSKLSALSNLKMTH